MAANTQDDVLGVVEIDVEGERAYLEKLFVEPQAMERGVGAALFEWARDAARAQGAGELQIVADPGAVGFYRRMGAASAGTVPSGSVPGRDLPVLTLIL